VVFAGIGVPTTEMLRDAPRLRFLQKLGAGYDNVDLEMCRARQIGVARLPGNNAATVAEHTILLMLAVYRHLVDLDRWVRDGNWGKERGRERNRELRRKTVGIVGFGQIGVRVAERLAGFDVEILYYDAVRVPAELEERVRATYVELDDLLERADVVSLHCPLTSETRLLIDRSRISRMKPGSIIINTARGEVVDEAALADALRAGHLSGAGLDAVVNERPGGASKFHDLDNVVLTPHIAGESIDNFSAKMERAFANAQLYLQGKPLPELDVVWVPAPVHDQGD
jgi:lactate dehydrogenase-like 2-hydroxyacid dehydrogenase